MLDAGYQASSIVHRASGRRGISLLEVLISMFVMLFGLMGVAAIFPVGNHYAGRGEQYDRTAALTDQAFAEIKARGMLNPYAWLYPRTAWDASIAAPENNAVIRPRHVSGPGTFNSLLGTPSALRGPGQAFVIDSMGIAAAREQGILDSDVFPFALFGSTRPDGFTQGESKSASNTANPWMYSTGNPTWGVMGNRWPIRRVTLPATTPYVPNMTTNVARTIFRLRDDFTASLPDEGDRPGIQQWQSNNNNTPDNPSDDIPLTRQNTGSYSWIATVVPTRMTPTGSGGLMSGVSALQPSHPEYNNQLYDVSVAVFYKRDFVPSAGSERTIRAQLNPGSELVMFAQNNNELAVDNALRDIRQGQWIALAGVHRTTGLFLLKWYKLLSLDEETTLSVRTNVTGNNNAARFAMLEGPDWPSNSIDNVYVILMPGVIGVSTQSLPMEPN
jgi:hypothetical protein